MHVIIRHVHMMQTQNSTREWKSLLLSASYAQLGSWGCDEGELYGARTMTEHFDTENWKGKQWHWNTEKLFFNIIKIFFFVLRFSNYNLQMSSQFLNFTVILLFTWIPAVSWKLLSHRPTCLAFLCWAIWLCKVRFSFS